MRILQRIVGGRKLIWGKWIRSALTRGKSHFALQGRQADCCSRSLQGCADTYTGANYSDGLPFPGVNVGCNRQSFRKRGRILSSIGSHSPQPILPLVSLTLLFEVSGLSVWCERVFLCLYSLGDKAATMYSQHVCCGGYDATGKQRA